MMNHLVSHEQFTSVENGKRGGTMRFAYLRMLCVKESSLPTDLPFEEKNQNNCT